eukprot:SAG11_NODE_15538_length_574_cov_2.387368_2_plen_32_part_01
MYVYRLRAENAVGWSGWSAPAAVTVAAAAPVH